MAVSIKRVVNSGLRITDTVKIPVIKVVIDVDDGVLPTDTFETLYALSAGMACAGAYWQNPRHGEIGDFENIPSGETVYGDNNGFSISVTKMNDFYISDIWIYFNGTLLYQSQAYTQDEYSTVPLFIFVDENNNIYKPAEGGGWILRNFCYNNPPGVSVVPRVAPIFPIAQNVTSIYPAHGSGNMLRALNPNAVGDISDYIINEIYVDPYDEIPESGPGGLGDGTFDFSSTPIDFQGLPTIGAMDTGMIDLYVPSAGQLAALSNYLWAGAFDPDNFKKLLADPMDAIIGLSIVPVSAAEIGTSAATLAVGNISTGLSMPKATRQYISIDCGSVSVLPKYGAYLDFAPNSKLQLFLPYIGIVDISPDDCMNGSISVRYSVDILGGMCVAQVKCNDHVLYEFSGSCSCACPVTAGQYQNVALTALKVAGSVAGMIGGGAAGLATGLENVANSVIASAKPEIQRSGGFGGSSGLMGHQVPFLILTIPKMARPGQQNSQMGYPSFVTKTLSDMTGYAEIETIHLAGVPATDAEQDEIVQLLQGGVYL